MPSQNEWRQAFDHLLTQLRQREVDSSVVVDVENAAATRMKIEPEELERRGDADMVLLSAEARKDLDLLKYRAPTPREAFISAAEVMIAKLREMPALADRLSELLKQEPEEIQWRPDASEAEFASAQESFSCSDIALSKSERTEIEVALSELEELLGLRGDNNGDS